MSGTHALFAPSKAAVWFNCAGALAVTKDLPEEPSSIHAASGTFTHSLGERILNNQPIPKLRTAETHDGFEFKLDSERLERALRYADDIRARGGLQFYECKLPLKAFIRVEDNTGTSDVVIAHLENVGEEMLEIVDLKDGNGIVLAKDNEQLLSYLCMAWLEYSYLADFKKFKVSIWQGKVGHYDSHTYTLAEVTEWLEQARRRAARAAEVISLSPAKQMAALNAGPWCDKGWCRARGTCPAYSALRKAVVPDTRVPTHMLTIEQVGELLSKRKEVEEWFKQLAEAALNMAKGGAHVPGFKLASGREGNRKWSDAKGEEEVAELMYEAIQADTYTRDLISPTEAERKLKKKHPETWTAIQKYITRSEAQPTLVPIADHRPAITSPGIEFASVDSGDDLL